MARRVQIGHHRRPLRLSEPTLLPGPATAINADKRLPSVRRVVSRDGADPTPACSRGSLHPRADRASRSLLTYRSSRSLLTPAPPLRTTWRVLIVRPADL